MRASSSRRAALSALGAVAAALATASAANAATVPVSIQHASFDPSLASALVGDTVRWTNTSSRAHTVRATGGAFDSPRLGSRGSFSHPFAEPGDYPYFCTIHPFMRGEVRVRHLLLSAPRGPVAPGATVTLRGRAPAGTATVTIERDSGSGFEQISTATPDAEGAFEAPVVAEDTAFYRAVAELRSSDPVRVVVLSGTELRLAASYSRRRVGLRVRARPASPGAHVVLQMRSRERFGWYPLKAQRLDDDSRARFQIRRPRRDRRVRVVLTESDRATVLAKSAVLKIRGRR